MSGVFYLTVGLPMNVSNLNRCAIALERQVDALDAQIAVTTPGSVEQESLSAMRQQYADVAMPSLMHCGFQACLSNENYKQGEIWKCTLASLLRRYGSTTSGASLNSSPEVSVNIILPADATAPDVLFVVACVFSLFIGFISGLLVK